MYIYILVMGVVLDQLVYVFVLIRHCVVKPKFHYANFPETSPDGEVSGKSAKWNLG